MRNIKDNITLSLERLRILRSPSPFHPKISVDLRVVVEAPVKRGFRLLARRIIENGRIKVLY